MLVLECVTQVMPKQLFQKENQELEQALDWDVQLMKVRTIEKTL